MSKYDIRYVDELNDMVREYNRHVPKEREIQQKETCTPINVQWTVGTEFNDLEYIIFKLHEDWMKPNVSATEFEDREQRLAQELVKYKKRGLYDVLRTILWIINNLYDNNVVWGVGRGSSVSSYVLYVIGVHDVDSYGYDLDIDDFLHD